MVFTGKLRAGKLEGERGRGWGGGAGPPRGGWRWSRGPTAPGHRGGAPSPAGRRIRTRVEAPPSCHSEGARGCAARLSATNFPKTTPEPCAPRLAKVRTRQTPSAEGSFCKCDAWTAQPLNHGTAARSLSRE